MQVGSARDSQTGTPDLIPTRAGARTGPVSRCCVPTRYCSASDGHRWSGHKPTGSVRASPASSRVDEGDTDPVADGGYPSTGDALGAAKETSGQHQVSRLVDAEPVAFHEFHPTNHRTECRFDLFSLAEQLGVPRLQWPHPPRCQTAVPPRQLHIRECQVQSLSRARYWARLPG